jgi:glycosyltransferase involved in cell wall biosynthesis
MSVVFLVATYNESEEIENLLSSVAEHVQDIVVSDDGSTDDTIAKVNTWAKQDKDRVVEILYNDHVGLAETIKAIGTDYIRYTISPDTWILMLDADERMLEPTLQEIIKFTNSSESENFTHVWFTLEEYMDGLGPYRVFQKCRLFRANSALFSNTVHEDDRFWGQGMFSNWKVIHRKSVAKQIMREHEYLLTYDRLLKENKVTQEWVERCIGFHYFVKELGVIPHG